MEIKRKNKALVFPAVGKVSMIVFAVLLIGSGIRAYDLFGYIFRPNVTRDTVLLVPSGSGYKDVESKIIEEKILENHKAFRWVAKRKKYCDAVRPGRYLLKKGMNTNQLVNLLRSGQQTPVNVTFNNVRTFEELAGKVSAYFESDSLAFLEAFKRKDLSELHGFNDLTYKALFIPNTYEFFWNTEPEKFIERMAVEYKRFWNEERAAKAKALELTPVEVVTLASIVQEETNKNEEKAAIAGVYLNRLQKGMPLQADPTVKYAHGDFTIRRITFEMLEIASPFNTYKNIGLPPGPICFPEVTSIEAVLNPEKHNYLYFCAKHDLSGFHSFARTLSEHNANAARYHRALNAQRIYK